MINVIISEFLKTKHTSLQKIVLLIPLLNVVVAGGFCSLGGEEVLKLTNVTSINFWGLIWLPALIVLLCGLFNNLEKKSTGYKTIFGFPINIKKVWISKCLVITTYTLIASILLWGFIALFDVVFLKATFSFEILFRCLLALVLTFLMNLWQIPLYLYLSQKINYFLLMIISCVLSIGVAPITAIKSNWWLMPFSWSLRVEAPITKIHPNGIPLESGNSLLTFEGFLYAAILSIVMLIILLVITTKLFNSKEV